METLKQEIKAQLLDELSRERMKDQLLSELREELKLSPPKENFLLTKSTIVFLLFSIITVAMFKVIISH